MTVKNPKLRAIGGGASISPKTSGRLMPLTVLTDAVITPAPHMNIDIPGEIDLMKV